MVPSAGKMNFPTSIKIINIISNRHALSQRWFYPPWSWHLALDMGQMGNKTQSLHPVSRKTWRMGSLLLPSDLASSHLCFLQLQLQVLPQWSLNVLLRNFVGSLFSANSHFPRCPGAQFTHLFPLNLGLIQMSSPQAPPSYLNSVEKSSPLTFLWYSA